MESTRSQRLLWVVLAAALLAAVIAVVVWISTTGDDGDDDDPVAPGTTASAEAPTERLELHTAAGFEQLVAQTKAKFGTTIVGSAVIYPDYASMEVVTPEDPSRVENWFFGKGFEGDPTTGSRPPGATTIDLAAVDPAAYAKSVRRSSSVLGVEDITSTYVVIRDPGDEPSFSVYVRNDVNENGYWTFALDGKQLRRYAFE